MIRFSALFLLLYMYSDFHGIVIISIHSWQTCFQVDSGSEMTSSDDRKWSSAHVAGGPGWLLLRRVSFIMLAVSVLLCYFGSFNVFALCSVCLLYIVFTVVLCYFSLLCVGATTECRGSGPPQNLDGPPQLLRSFLMKRVWLCNRLHQTG